jgi:hypothetical protein
MKSRYPDTTLSGSMLLHFEIERVNMSQVSLPFATDHKGSMVYEKMIEG